MNQTYMKEKPVLPLLLSMAAPMILSMLVNSLYNIIDSIFVAKISEDAMTALSLVYPVQNLINSIAVGFGIGINVMIAFSLGAGDDGQTKKAASQGIFLSVLHGLLLMVLGLFLMPAFLKMFTSNNNILSLGLQYSNIVLCFSAVLTLQVAYEKIFQAVGRMMVSMCSMMCGCILNILLDPIFIFGLGPIPSMGIRGAALATGLGQTISLLIYLFFYQWRPISVRISLSHIKPEGRICARLYGVGIPASLNMALPSVLISALNGILSAFSQSYVVVLGVYYKLQTFLYLSANGMVQGMRPLIGYNYGAGEKKRVHSIYFIALALIVCIMAAGTILCFTIPEPLIGLFSEQQTTIQIGGSALRIISIGFIVSSVSVVSSGALEGLGKGTESLIVSLLRYVVVILPTAFFLSRFLGADGVWHAFWITEFITAAASWLIYQKAQK